MLRYDPTCDLFDYLNTSELTDTPIGTLRVLQVGDKVAVCKMDECDPTQVSHPIYFLGKNENPLAAIYGKRFWEKRAAINLIRRRDDFVDNSKAVDAHNSKLEFKERLAKFQQKRADGREALLSLQITEG